MRQMRRERSMRDSFWMRDRRAAASGRVADFLKWVELEFVEGMEQFVSVSVLVRKEGCGGSDNVSIRDGVHRVRKAADQDQPMMVAG